MKLRRLSFAALGPFRDEQEIDFDRLDDLGVFLISGRTGAGKSTILDAVCFALYGSVPRFEGGVVRLRSDHATPEDVTFAELDFETDGRVYRVRRSPEYERPAKRGGGTTKQAAKAELLELRDGEWYGMSTSAREIGTEIGRIVGLSKDQFLQVILLAQNRFQEFLLAKNDDRQKLLRTLFATERFESLRRRLVEKRQAEGAELESARADLTRLAGHAQQLASGANTDADADHDTGEDALDAAAAVDGEPPAPVVHDVAWFTSLLDGLGARTTHRRRLAEESDGRLAAADEHRAHLVRLAQSQERRALARVERDRVAADAPRAELARTELDAAQRARSVIPLLAVRRTASVHLTRAEATLEAARSRYVGRSLPAPDDRSSALSDWESIARRVADERADSRGALAEALADEKREPTLDADLRRSFAVLERIDRDLRAIAEERDGLPARIASVEEELTEARGLAVLLPTHAAEVEALGARVEAARTLTTRTAELEARSESYARAAEEHGRAAESHAALVAARFAGFAAELAADLRPGAPCAVCGSVEHPEPATPHDGRIVGAAEIEAARLLITDRARSMDEAAASEREASLAVTALRATVGDADPSDLLARLEAARELARVAREAERRVTARASDRTTLLDRIEALDARAVSTRSERADAAEAVTAARTALDALRERIGRERGDHRSVADRASALTDDLSAASGLVDAIAEVAARREAAERAQADVDTALEEHGFTGAEEAENAARSAAEIAELDRRIRDVERRRATVDAMLADPALADVPEETVDPALAVEAADRARAERDAAHGALAALIDRASSLGEVVEEAIALFAALADRIERFDELRSLSEAIDGRGQNTRRMDLEAFALAGRLEEIVAAANVRLSVMTSNRYALVHDDSLAFRNTASGLGLDVLDAYTGVRRPPTSLSGGETFLASLALALGLADAVTARTGGVTLETMFIDEGFGSLDAETLETAMSTLDGLRANGRTVGLISHVDTMTERIAVGLRVVVSDRGDSAVLPG